MISCCETCQGQVLVEDREAGDMVCPACGTVAAERIFQVGEDERHFDSEETDRKHTATVDILTEDLSMATSIRRDGTEASLALRKAHAASRVADNGQGRCFAEIEKLAAKFRGNIGPDCIFKAKSLAKDFLTMQRNAKGRRLCTVAAVCIYLAATHFHGIPIKLVEMVNEAQEDRKTFNRYYSKICSAFKEKGEPLPPQSNQDFVERYVEGLDLVYKHKGRMDRILERVQSTSAITRQPSTLAAAVVFFVCEHSLEPVLTNDRRQARAGATGKAEQDAPHPVDITDLSHIANIATPTIRRCYEEDLLPRKQELVALLAS